MGTSGPGEGEVLLSRRWPVVQVAFGPSGTTLAVVPERGNVQLWDASKREPVEGRPPHVSRRKRRQERRSRGDLDARHVEIAECVAFSPDGRTLAVGGFYTSNIGDPFPPVWVVSLRDAATGAFIGEPFADDAQMPLDGGHTEDLTSIAFSPDGAVVATSSLDGTARFWDVASGSPGGWFQVAGHEARACAFSPDGTLFVTGDSDGRVEFRAPDTGSESGEPLTAHAAAVHDLAFTPDGRLLATSCAEDESIHLWDAADRVQIGALTSGHPARGLAFSPDGSLLASAGADGMIRVWDVADRRQALDPLPGHLGPVNSVAFTPDARVLASAGDDGTVRIRSLPAR